MTAQILFHPQLKAIDAARIAREQGGRLVWRSARKRINRWNIEAGKWHNAQAAAAIEAENYGAALAHLRAAHEAIFGKVQEVSPCVA